MRRGLRALGLLALGLFACQPPPLKGTKRGELVVSVEGDSQAAAVELAYDVGTVAVGQRQEIVVRAANVGADALTVSSATLASSGNGSWFVRDISKTLAPGASLTTTVTFAPVGVGPQTTRVTFAHDADAAFPSVRLDGTGR